MSADPAALHTRGQIVAQDCPTWSQVRRFSSVACFRRTAVRTARRCLLALFRRLQKQLAKDARSRGAAHDHVVGGCGRGAKAGWRSASAAARRSAVPGAAATPNRAAHRPAAAAASQKGRPAGWPPRSALPSGVAERSESPRRRGGCRQREAKRMAARPAAVLTTLAPAPSGVLPPLPAVDEGGAVRCGRPREPCRRRAVAIRRAVAARRAGCSARRVRGQAGGG